jgi:DNA-binding MarR family transcriptional regulator
MITGYMLTNEGVARFRKRKALTGEDQVHEEGYDILNYLYEYGGAPLEEIIRYTGLPRSKVTQQLSVFLSHGLVEGMTK